MFLSTIQWRSIVSFCFLPYVLVAGRVFRQWTLNKFVTRFFLLSFFLISDDAWVPQTQQEHVLVTCPEHADLAPPLKLKMFWLWPQYKISHLQITRPKIRSECPPVIPPLSFISCSWWTSLPLPNPPFPPWCHKGLSLTPKLGVCPAHSDCLDFCYDSHSVFHRQLSSSRVLSGN